MNILRAMKKWLYSRNSTAAQKEELTNEGHELAVLDLEVREPAADAMPEVGSIEGEYERATITRSDFHVGLGSYRKVIGVPEYLQDVRWAKVPMPTLYARSGNGKAFDMFRARILEKTPGWQQLQKALLNQEESAGSASARMLRWLDNTTVNDNLYLAGLTREEIMSAMVDALCSYSFRECSGAIIETTRVLDDWLENVDIGEDISPLSFRPPYPATYIHFGSPRLVMCGRKQHEFVGAYVFSKDIEHFHIEDDETSRLQARRWNVKEGEAVRRVDIKVVDALPSEDGGGVGGNSFTLLLRQDSSLSMQSSVRNGLSEYCAGEELAEICDRLTMIAKVFLYMAVADARIARVNDYSDAMAQISSLGRKKQSKLERRAASLCDKIIVGPVAMQDANIDSHAGSAIKPHWRRGHFRMQAHGEGNLLRKLIFIKPVIVRNDLLEGRITPKLYKIQ